MIAAFTADVLLGLVMLIVFAPLGFLLWVIYSRVLLEVVMVLFRIMETNTELVALQRGSQTSAPSYSPPPYSPPRPSSSAAAAGIAADRPDRPDAASATAHDVIPRAPVVAATPTPARRPATIAA